MTEGFFISDENKPITIIDTVGFDDAQKDTDSETAVLIKRLKDKIDHIHMFVIVLDGQNPRIDKSLNDMLQLFAVVFTEKVWEHVLIVFTKVSMCKKQIMIRRKDRVDDDVWAEKYLYELSKQVGSKPNYVFIDAKYCDSDPEETAAFHTSVKSLYKTLENNTGFKTDTVRETEFKLEVEKKKAESAEKERKEEECKRMAAEEERADESRKRQVAEKERAEKENQMQALLDKNERENAKRELEKVEQEREKATLEREKAELQKRLEESEDMIEKAEKKRVSDMEKAEKKRINDLEEEARKTKQKEDQIEEELKKRKEVELERSTEARKRADAEKDRAASDRKREDAEQASSDQSRKRAEEENRRKKAEQEKDTLEDDYLRKLRDQEIRGEEKDKIIESMYSKEKIENARTRYFSEKTTTVEGQSSVNDEVDQEQLAQRVRKTASQIQRESSSSKKIYKPKFHKSSVKSCEGDILIVGEPNDRKPEKVIMLIGAKNRGKSTFINSLLNHMLSVRVEDNFRFKIALEKECMTVYKVNSEDLDFCLTIVDIPSFEEQSSATVVIQDLMSSCQNMNLTNFHDIFLVVKSTDTELSGSEKEVFSKLQDAFQIRPSVIANFSDGANPPVKVALADAKIHTENIFMCNNSAFFANIPDKHDWIKWSTKFEELLEHISSSDSTTKLPLNKDSWRNMSKRRKSYKAAASKEKQGTFEDLGNNDVCLSEELKDTAKQIKGSYSKLNFYTPKENQRKKETIVYGEENNFEEKVIIVVGAKDCGKSTFINSLVNHLWGVKVTDDFRFKIAIEGSPIKEYKLKNTQLGFNLTIVDIPSFEEESKVKKIKKDMIQNNSLTDFHAIFFFVRFSDTKLSSNEKDIFRWLSGCYSNTPDVIASFCDTSDPPVKRALSLEKVAYDNMFRVHGAFFADTSDEHDWNSASSRLEELVKHLKSIDMPARLALTSEAKEKWYNPFVNKFRKK